MSRDQLRSELYAFLGDATSNPDGDAWDHDRLRVLVNRLMQLPAMADGYALGYSLGWRDARNEP